jgi:CRISPR/Cas system CSM-associated protein Csm3 (group 7 of RAMP superfamily)
MLSHPVNEIEITLTLKALSPLLIKEGRYTDTLKREWQEELLKRARQHGEDEEALKGRMPDAIPVSQSSIEKIKDAATARVPARAVNALSLYIPGSSLRGAWRSHLERSLRGMTDPNEARVCDPFDDKTSCSRWLAPSGDEDIPTDRKDHPYSDSCPVCRIFGSAAHAGRFSISDGVRNGAAGSVVNRDHVRIDRKDGKVAITGPFRFLGIQDAHFDITVRLRNFELWQLGLIASLIKDLEDARIALGSGKNKGYGKVKATVGTVTLTYIKTPLPITRLIGVAEHSIWGEYFQKRYGLHEYKGPEVPLTVRFESPTPWRATAVLDGAFLTKCREIPFIPENFNLLNLRQP